MKLLSLLLLALSMSALLISASPTTRTAGIVTNKLQLAIDQTNDLDELVGDTNLYNLFMNGPTIGIRLVDVICTVTGLLLTLTNTDDSFSSIDSEEIFQRILAFIASQDALMDRLSGRFGLLSSFSLSEPVRSSVLVLDTAVQQLAENSIRLVPVRRGELVEAFKCMRRDYQKLLKNYSGYKRAGEL